ncbi:putative aspartic-type endopeptidase [Rosellinia necatrix]|uniref:Putative aspartic-type endopeptidase n=1 Tax=Rosellinia necatrix TaxID=77044 RepID=A0A1S7UKM6_ROSNE|nr:putative aspartic-type endopeptidase [Rosellinia necatrix]
MHRVFIYLQFTLWITSIYALVQGLPESQYETRSQDVDPKSRGFVTFKLVKKSAVSNKLRVAITPRAPQSSSPGKAEPATIVERVPGYKVVKAQEPNFDNSAGIDQDGTDYSYFAEVELGSEGKKLYMLLDTGASTTWVMGSTCTSKSCLMHNTFGPDDSKTYNDTGKAYAVEYGTGSVRGHVVEDSLALAGLSVTLPFGVANTTSDQFTQFPFDGILGLATSSDTWLSAVKNAELIDANVFGISLSRNSDGTNDGEIVFGALNPNKYTGDITYSPVKSNSAWTILMDNILVSGSSAGFTGRSAYIDTGTSFVFGPPDDVEAMYKLIPGSSSKDGSAYTIPCDTDSKIAFTFSGQSWNVSSKDFISPPNSNGICTGNIYGMEYVPGGWLLGDVFLKNVYSVFDVDNGQIGFAAKAISESTEPSTTTTTDPMATASPAETGSGSTSAVPTDSSTGLNGHETPSADAPGDQPTDGSAQPDSSGSIIGIESSIALLAALFSTIAMIA